MKPAQHWYALLFAPFRADIGVIRTATQPVIDFQIDGQTPMHAECLPLRIRTFTFGKLISNLVPTAGATLKQFHLVVQALKLAQAITPKEAEGPGVPATDGR
jgi:hypothetical protein